MLKKIISKNLIASAVVLSFFIIPVASAISHEAGSINTDPTTQTPTITPTPETQKTQKPIDKIKKYKGAIKKKIKQRTVPGIVSEISSDMLKMSSGNKIYTIKVIPETQVVDRFKKKINLSDVKTGDKINVTGKVEGINIEAKIVLNISLPIKKEQSQKQEKRKNIKDKIKEKVKIKKSR